MQTKDITTLIKILNHKDRQDLAELLINCRGEINESGEYGSMWNSVVSCFLIYAPLEQYYKLKKLKNEDTKFLLENILEIYPIQAGKPEITTIEYRILQEDEHSGESVSVSHIGRTSRVFISYSSQDKALAGIIKSGLEEYGLEVFLAHEDIEPALEWQEVILENLDSTDIFLPIITKNYHNSFWADQESGIALAKNKLIVPLGMDGYHSYGFLGKWQTLRLKPDEPNFTFSSIIKAIINAKPSIKNQILDSLIKSFTGSKSFQDAKIKSRHLSEFDSIATGQVNEIFKASIQNNQIYESFGAKSALWNLYYNNKEKISEELKDEIQHKLGIPTREIKEEISTQQ